ncbi:MAG: DinB family protein [Anaerolineaceae bacterium]|nr:DinB family protein [Anaerolineaceae bacterium]
MIDFSPLQKKEISFPRFSKQYTKEDLADATCEMMNYLLSRIKDLHDQAVTFQPLDPKADDPFAASQDDVGIAWTLAHVIVHITASMEESAALAAELARGVEVQGRSRYETPWESVTTLVQCQQRLLESQRMCLASLDMWPDEPHLDNEYSPWKGMGKIDARGRYILGLQHSDDHFGQISDILDQYNKGL